MPEPSRELSLEDKVADLTGSVVAVESMLCGLVESFAAGARGGLLDRFEQQCEVARLVLQELPLSPRVVQALERDRRVMLERYR